MQGAEFHVETREYGTPTVGTGSIDKVNGYAGSGINDKAVGVGEKFPRATCGGDAVGAKSAGGGVIDGNGESGVGAEDMDRSARKGKR
jgi:hypothetical protein